MSFSARFDVGALDQWAQDLHADVQQAVRLAAQAGAQVLYQLAKANIRSSTQGHWFHGTSFKTKGTKYWFDAGTLSRSMYQVYSQDNSGRGVATYHISWNHKKAPYGFMVEYGTVKTRPVGFLRRASLHMPQALQAAEAEFHQRLKHFK